MGMGEPARSLINTHPEEARESPRDSKAAEGEEAQGGQGRPGHGRRPGPVCWTLLLVINYGGRKGGKDLKVRLGGRALQGPS